jgi:hypothetical protein
MSPRAQKASVVTTAGEITFLIKSSHRRQQQHAQICKANRTSAVVWANSKRALEFVDLPKKKCA